ncbi:MAG: IPT/TIG domain-containing protein [Candidatus Eremiobacteraeota bacterium]|nr:IPT/TIG domain-containing protein [Candidatus Eremiobacteraeota bacterium]
MKTGKLLAVLCVAAFMAFAMAGCGGGSGDAGGGYWGGGGSSSTTPVVSSVTNTSGTSTLTPGQECVIRGSNFGTRGGRVDTSKSYVTFVDNTTASSPLYATVYLYWGSDRINCLTPELVAGRQYTIIVTIIVSGQAVSSTSSASPGTNTITPTQGTNPPTISSISPSTVNAGQNVVITGTNFAATQATGSYVAAVNGDTVGTVVSWSNTQLTITIPSGATAGTYQIYVHTDAGGNSNLYNITVVSSSGPAITSVSPTTQGLGGQVIITGSGFGSSQGTNYVVFSGSTSVTQSTVSSWGDTQVICNIPLTSSQGSVNVYINVNGAYSNGYTITITSGTPVITSIVPGTVNQGAQITITGTGFTTTQGTITVGSTQIAVNSWTATQVVGTIPTTYAVGAAAVYVTAGGTNSSSYNISVVSASAPTISYITPSTATAGQGQTLTIVGTNLGTTQGTSTVTVSTTGAGIISWGTTGTSVQFTVPVALAAGTYSVYATISGTNTNTYPITLTTAAAPTITSGAQTLAGGGLCTLSGTNFGGTQGVGTVTFGGIAALAYGSWTSTGISCTVPYNCPPTGNVTVTTALGTASVAYTRTYAWGAASLRDSAAGGIDSPKVLFDRRTTNGGDALLVYQKHDGANTGIYSMRFSATGGWAAAVRIDAGGANCTSPDFAMDSNGKAIAVFVRGGTVIKSYTYDPATLVWTASTDLETAGAAAVATPKIAFDASNNAICVFRETIVAELQITARYWPSGGGWNAGALRLDSGDARDGEATPMIGFDGSNNGICTFLENDAGNTFAQLNARKYTAAGGWIIGSWGAPAVLSGGVNAASAPALAVQSGGTAAAVFVELGAVYCNRYTAGAWQAGGAATVLNAAAGSPYVAMDSSGYVYAVYVSGAGRTFVNRYVAAWTETQLDDGTAATTIPFIGFDPSGAYGMCGFVQSNRVVTRNYTASTNTWAAQQLVDGNTGNALTQLYIGAGSGPQRLPVWRDAGVPAIYSNIYR